MNADLFANAVKRIIERNLNITELFGCAEQLKAGGEQKLGVELYKIWLAGFVAVLLLFSTVVPVFCLTAPRRPLS